MPARAGVDSVCVPPSRIGTPWRWSPRLRHEIVRVAALPGPPLFHLHGIWGAPQYMGARIAREANIPFVVSAHGMLEPWLWSRQGLGVWLKKKTYWNLFAFPALRSAQVIHAITPLERTHLHSLFPSGRIEVIPNAIDLDENARLLPTGFDREKLILFLGRIEPKKGVDILLNAFASAKISHDWRIAVIGPVWSTAYQMTLERIVSENGLQSRVSFLGPLFGEEMRQWLGKAWVLAAPSHSEVVGLVNLEAAALKVPSITTHQTGLADWEEGGGLLINPSVDEMRQALEVACAWDERERAARGAASWALVSKRYSWGAVLPQWVELYRSMIASM